MNDVARTETARQFKWVGTRPVRPDGVPKVTGLAQYGTDLAMPGMLVGGILRSPYAHARIRSIDTSKAAALPGVKAVVTSADFPEQKFEYVGPERVAQNFWHMTRNIMAREKVLYEGHAVAAVAATSKAIADEALSLIAVDYEVLPHVIDVDDAMKPDAPLLFPDMITRGVEPSPSPSNIAKRNVFKLGDVEAGFAAADEIVEMSFKTAPVHQAYIEPQGCVAHFDADGQGEIWSSSQGHFVVRAYTAQLLGMKVGGGDDRFDARERRRLRHIDRADARMGVRRAQDPADQHVGHCQVCAVLGKTRDLRHAVRTNRPGPDPFERPCGCLRGDILHGCLPWAPDCACPA